MPRTVASPTARTREPATTPAVLTPTAPVVARTETPEAGRLLQLQRSVGNAATVAMIRRNPEDYAELDDDGEGAMEAMGGGSAVRQAADAELANTRRLIEAPEYIDSLVALQQALDAVKKPAVQGTDVGKRLLKPLQKATNSYMHYVGKVTMAESALRRAMEGGSDKAMTLATTYLGRQRIKLSTALRGVGTSTEEAKGILATYRKDGAKKNLDKNYAMLHPTVDLVTDRLKTVNTGIGVLFTVVGSAVAMPHAGVVAHSVISGAISGGSAVTKMGLQYMDNQDEGLVDMAKPLVSSGDDASDLSGKAGKGMNAVKYAAKGGAKVLDQFVPGAEGAIGALGDVAEVVGDAETPITKGLGKLDERRNKADLDKDKVDLDALEDAFA